jgi:hypothetical protein
VGKGGKCFVDVAELPLLASEEGVADDAVSVDRVQGGRCPSERRRDSTW